MKKIAFIRGNSLNEWEGKLWGSLRADFLVTGFSSQKALYKTNEIPFEVKKLASSADSRIGNIVNRYVMGVNEKMYGLETALSEFDIAHTAEVNYYYTLQAVHAKKNNSKLKVVTTVWDNSVGRFENTYGKFSCTPPNLFKKKTEAIIREVISGVDMFLPVSESSRLFLEDLGVKKEKMRVCMPGVIWNPDDASAEEILKKFELKTKGFYMMVNRMVREKGVYDILHTWRYLIKNSLTHKKLVCIGSGPESENMKMLACKWGIEKSIIFINQLPNKTIQGLHKHSYALLLGSVPTPIWQEQFGYVLAESITAGAPVISTQSGAIPEVVGNCGILVSPLNPYEFINSINKMENETLRDELSLKCRERKGFLSSERFSSDLIDIYRTI